MIVVKVELWSAITGEKRELARMLIDNVGGSEEIGNYRVRTLRGRSSQALDSAMARRLPGVTREGAVEGHYRKRDHVWHLVGKALSAIGYVKPGNGS